MKDFVRIFIVLTLILGLAHCQETKNSTSTNDNKSKNASAANSTKRTVAFFNFSFNFSTYQPDGSESVKELIPQSKSSNGTLLLDLATRGWKLQLNKKKGLALSPTEDPEDQPSSYLDKIFLEHIGNYEMLDKTTLLALRVLQPTKENQNIEVSQLRDYCWRVEIYTQADAHGIEYAGKMRFCLNSKKDHLLVWKYRYLLETRELGQTNKE